MLGSSTFLRRIVRSLGLLTILLGSPARGQVFSIADGNITTCVGAIVDSGGQGAVGYSNNENYTATICSDTPGQSISLSFVTFNLSAAGTPPADNLMIYDGPSAADPLLGVFTGNQLQGQIISASFANASGCLTLVFTSNDNGTGVWAAAITCYTPCLPPTAVADMGETAPALVCIGEDLTFDCSASFAAPGFNIVQQDWDFDDGTTATGAVVSHSFDAPGEYVVQLTITDNNGCTNTNLVDLQVFAGTTPLFTGTTPDLSVCQGGTIDLLGVATPVTWSAMPSIDFGAGVYLPDNVGQTFSSQLTYGFFPPGSTLTNVNDLLGICVDMEHSFMGDLVISITCPSGQSVVLHQQGGGGTYIGGANWNDDNNPQPGTCWNYCWSPNATQGTFAASSTAGVTMTGGTPPGDALVPGTYSSVNSLAALVGCPLNGTWTFSVTDLWGIDNGFLCSWNINFHPSLYPDLVQFTPVIGHTTDSMSWSGPDVVLDPNDPASASVTPTVPGSYDYTFTVTDNFGCTYDTTITLTVTNAPVVEATSVLGASCSDPTQVHAEIIAFAPPPPSCTWTLELHDSFGDGWNGGANIVFVIGGVPTTYTMPAGPDDVTISLSIPVGVSLQLSYTAGTVWNNENSFELVNYAGTIVYDSPQGPASGNLWQGPSNCGPNVGPVTWQWTPAPGVDAPNSPDANTQITQPTEFVVRVHPFGQPWCNTTDTILVTPPSFLENDSVVVDVLCNGGDGSITLISTGPGGPWNYTWVDDAGANVQSTQASNGDVFTGSAGTYTAYISEGPLGNGCLDTLTASIVEPTPLEWVSTPGDTLICLTGNAMLAASAQGGTGAITLQWNQGLPGNGPHTVSPLDTTQYSVQAMDANGCITQLASATVFVNPPLTFTPLAPDTECVGLPVVYAVLDAAGGNGQYTYDWGDGSSVDNSHSYLLPVSGAVCVTLRDGCETPPITSCNWLEILQTPPLVITADTTLGCAPLAVQLVLQDTTLQAQVEWTYGDGAVENEGDSVVHTYANAGNYSVSTSVTWPNGCITDTTLVDLIHVITVPIADVTWTPHPPTINDPTVHFQDLSVPNATSWWWDFGEGLGTSEEQDPVVEFPDEVGGSYPVTFVVANFLGCTDTLRTIVDVGDEFLVWIPNAFTPNSEGENETFFVSGNDISSEEYQLRIFDRWGHEVFGSTDPAEHWDGTSGGDVLPQGVYVYRLKVRSLSSRQKRTIMGHVGLLR